MQFFRPILNLRTADLVSIIFLCLLSLLNIFFHTRIPEWWVLITCNILVVLFIVYAANRYSVAPRYSFRRIIRDWYPVPIVVGIFKQLYFMVHPIRQKDYDELLIQIDHWLFGVNPTEWLAQFSHPIVTEILQIAYATYYFLFLIVGYELYKKGMMKEFYYTILLFVYGFYLSYLGYFLVPAVGPRFTIHDFHTINEALPGLFFTEYIRAFLDWGESIPRNVPNPEDYVQRDVFPSAHTQLTLVAMYAVALFKLKCRNVIWILGTLIIIATVYLWYHYIIDIMAGVVFFILTIWSARFIDEWWNRKRTT